MMDTGWTIDRKVPVVLIFALLLQVIAITWFIAALDGRVLSVESNVVLIRERASEATLRTQERIDNLLLVQQDQALQLGKIAEQIIGIQADIVRILALLEKP